MMPGSDEEGENEELLAFRLEFLPGSVKSKWAQQYQFDRNQAIENSLDFKGRVFDKLRTKGRFEVENKTNAGNWVKDRAWKRKANSLYNSLEVHRAKIDQELLAKKKDQKRLQYMALEDQYKLHVKIRR